MFAGRGNFTCKLITLKLISYSLDPLSNNCSKSLATGAEIDKEVVGNELHAAIWGVLEKHIQKNL